MKRRIMTKEMATYIKRNRLKIPGTEIAKRLGLPREMVHRFLRRNGLTPPKDLKLKWRAGAMFKPFQPWEDKVIKDLIFVCSTKEVAIYLNRGNVGIGKRVHELGLGWVLQWKKEASKRRPGSVPPNKGKKMRPEVYERIKHTLFRKGNVPHNTAEGDGVVRVRKDTRTGIPYKYIRVALGKWELYHRYLWERAHGKIPEGHVISFKDGNSENCVLENLECISFASNAVRNSNHDNPSDNRIAFYMATKSREVDKDLQKELVKYPALIELKRKQLLLNRKIKQHGKEQNKKGT